MTRIPTNLGSCIPVTCAAMTRIPTICAARASILNSKKALVALYLALEDPDVALRAGSHILHCLGVVAAPES